MNGQGNQNELLRPYRIGQLSSTTNDSAACTSAAVKTPVSSEFAARSSARWCHAAAATNSIRIRVADRTATPRRAGSESVEAVSEPVSPADVTWGGGYDHMCCGACKTRTHLCRSCAGAACAAWHPRLWRPFVLAPGAARPMRG